MGPVTGVIAGFAAAVGALAAYRALLRRAQTPRKKVDGLRAGARREIVIDLERDPTSGVFRAK